MDRLRVTRPCKVCGMFYPRDAAVLRREIDTLLDAVKPPPAPAGIKGMVAPHAGYVYSGATAARGYGLLRGSSYETVVIIAPSHREYFDGVSVYPGDAYETPLGSVPVDTGLRDRLLEETPLVRASESGHRDEHAVEVQLPFLQHVLPPFRFLPLVIGDQTDEHCRELGRALAVVLHGMNSLIIASSDLSHYHPLVTAQQLDQVVMHDVSRFDPEALLDHLGHGACEACGGGPIAAMMTALRMLGAGRMAVLHHSTSADTTGDEGAVVGYLSAAAYA